MDGDGMDAQALANEAAMDDEMDAGYAKAMLRLAELKQRPVESLTEGERKEKLRLANRESARKMRRKQSDTLTAAEKKVKRLEAENVAHMNKLAEGWYKYKEIRAENDLLRTELQTLQTYQGADGTEGAAAAPAAMPPAPEELKEEPVEQHAPMAEAKMEDQVPPQGEIPAEPSSELTE